MTDLDSPCCPVLHVESLAHQEKAVVHRSICRNRNGSVTLFAIDDGECIAEHQSHNEEILLVLDGEIELQLAGTPRYMKKGEYQHIRPHTLHQVRGIRGGKILLTILRNPPPRRGSQNTVEERRQ